MKLSISKTQLSDTELFISIIYMTIFIVELDYDISIIEAILLMSWLSWPIMISVKSIEI